MRGGFFQMLDDLVVFFKGGSGKNTPSKSVTQALQPVDDGRKSMVRDPVPQDANRIPVTPETTIDADPTVAAIHLAGDLDTALPQVVPKYGSSDYRINDTPTTPDEIKDINASLAGTKTLANPLSADPASRPATQALAANFTLNEALQQYVMQADDTRFTLLFNSTRRI